MNIDFKITEFLNLPASIMAALSLASGIILFSPKNFLSQLFLLDFRENNGFIIGIIFVISLSILLINLIYQTIKFTSTLIAKKRFYSSAEDRLLKLNDYQKAIIYLLYEQENRTHPLPLHDGAIMELEQNYFIGKAATQYMVSDLNNAAFPYLLHPWVSDELNSNSDLLSNFLTSYELINE